MKIQGGLRQSDCACGAHDNGVRAVSATLALAEVLHWGADQYVLAMLARLSRWHRAAIYLGEERPT